MSFDIPQVENWSGAIQALKTQGESITNKQKRAQFAKAIQAAETAIIVLDSAIEDIRHLLEGPPF